MDNVAFTKRVNQLVNQFLKVQAKELVAIQRQEVPVDTGTLRASIAMKLVGQNEWLIGYRPDLLKAKSKGKDYAPEVFWGSVRNGRKPNDWITRTIKDYKIVKV